MIRTVKHGLEAKLGEKLDRKGPVFEWLVEWAGELITRYTVDKWGRTPVEK